MSERVYTVSIDKGVQKALDRLPAEINNRLVLALRGLAQNPRPHGSVKLEGSESDYRIRVGNYRILYRIRDERLLVLILEVGHRKDVYRKK